jgi:nucleoside-diphosphate-sugar epimerase
MILRRGCSSPVPQLHRDQPGPIFLEGGHTVGGVDSDPYRRCTFGDEAAIADVPAVGGAIRDITLGHLNGIDAVVYLAALSKDPLGPGSEPHLHDQPSGFDPSSTSRTSPEPSSPSSTPPATRAHDQAFNIGSTTENDQMRQLAEIVAETLPGCRVELAPGASPDTRPRALRSWRLTACPPRHARVNPEPRCRFSLAERTPSRPRHGMRRTEGVT